MFRVAIVGSRTFNNPELLRSKMDVLMSNKWDEEVVIVSGGARGADRIAENYAKERGVTLKVFKADWNKNGKSAGFIRNLEMLRNVDAVVAFWDGKSRGTKHMLESARARDIETRVIEF